MISVIIPTRNEQEYLPELLSSIRKQGMDNLEIIVADASSTDGTRKIARNYDCLVVEGGLPAEGRNNGAKYAKGDILVFKDADSPLPDNFLKPAIHEFDERNLNVAGTLHYALSSKNGFAKLRYKTYIEFFSNHAIKSAENTHSPLMMTCMFARKNVHNLIGGFDETLTFAEDCEYAKRAKRAGAKFGILMSCGKVGFNMRRFEEKEFATLIKNVYFNAGRALGHEFKRGIDGIKYW